MTARCSSGTCPWRIRNYAALAATTVVRSAPIVILPEPEEAGPVPFGSGNCPRDGGEAGIAASIPDKPVGDDGRSSGGLAHGAAVDGAGSGPRRSRPPLTLAAARPLGKGARGEAPTTLLAIVGDAERKKLLVEPALEVAIEAGFGLRLRFERTIIRPNESGARSLDLGPHCGNCRHADQFNCYSATP
jgi:hypothetical protein